MAQQKTEHLLSGFLFKGTDSFTIWPVDLEEAHIFSAYPVWGSLGAEFLVKNIRYQRYQENNANRWRVNFEVENMTGPGVAYELFWTRIFQ